MANRKSATWEVAAALVVLASCGSEGVEYGASSTTRVSNEAIVSCDPGGLVEVQGPHDPLLGDAVVFEQVAPIDLRADGGMDDLALIELTIRTEGQGVGVEMSGAGSAAAQSRRMTPIELVSPVSAPTPVVYAEEMSELSAALVLIVSPLSSPNGVGGESVVGGAAVLPIRTYSEPAFEVNVAIYAAVVDARHGDCVEVEVPVRNGLWAVGGVVVREDAGERKRRLFGSDCETNADIRRNPVFCEPEYPG